MAAGSLGEPDGRDLAWIVEWNDGPCGIRSLCRGNDGRVDQRDWVGG
ncbi:MAG: hypothetical protein ACYS0D_15310 [Planctomycetota bacterium]|jgi:hypothetical protein